MFLKIKKFFKGLFRKDKVEENFPSVVENSSITPWKSSIVPWKSSIKEAYIWRVDSLLPCKSEEFIWTSKNSTWTSTSKELVWNSEDNTQDEEIIITEAFPTTHNVIDVETLDDLPNVSLVDSVYFVKEEQKTFFLKDGEWEEIGEYE